MVTVEQMDCEISLTEPELRVEVELTPVVGVVSGAGVEAEPDLEPVREPTAGVEVDAHCTVIVVILPSVPVLTVEQIDCDGALLLEPVTGVEPEPVAVVEPDSVGVLVEVGELSEAVSEILAVPDVEIGADVEPEIAVHGIIIEETLPSVPVLRIEQID